MARKGKAHSTPSAKKAKGAAKVTKKTSAKKAREAPALASESSAENLRRELRGRKAEFEQHKNEAAGDATDDRAGLLRRELLELRAELEHRHSEEKRSAERDGVAGWLDPVQANDLRTFIAERSEQVQQRKYQMSLIKDFIADPSRFGLTPGDVPTSTSFEEFAERRAELNYRIATVKTFLDLLTEELRQLDLAETYARRERGPKKPPARSRGKAARGQLV